MTRDQHPGGMGATESSWLRDTTVAGRPTKIRKDKKLTRGLRKMHPELGIPLKPSTISIFLTRSPRGECTALFCSSLCALRVGTQRAEERPEHALDSRHAWPVRDRRGCGNARHRKGQQHHPTPGCSRSSSACLDAKKTQRVATAVSAGSGGDRGGQEARRSFSSRRCPRRQEATAANAAGGLERAARRELCGRYAPLPPAPASAQQDPG